MVSTEALAHSRRVKVQSLCIHTWELLPLARNFCGPRILRIAVRRPSADNISANWTFNCTLGVVNKHLRIIFLRLLIHSQNAQNFWAAEMSSYTVAPTHPPLLQGGIRQVQRIWRKETSQETWRQRGTIRRSCDYSPCVHTYKWHMQHIVQGCNIWFTIHVHCWRGVPQRAALENSSLFQYESHAATPHRVARYVYCEPSFRLCLFHDVYISPPPQLSIKDLGRYIRSVPQYQKELSAVSVFQQPP